MKKRILAALLVLSMLLPYCFVVPAEAAADTTEELIAQQFDAFAKGLKPGGSVDVMSRLVNHSVKNGGTLTMNEKDTFSKGLLNAGLFRSGFIAAVLAAHSYMSQNPDDKLYVRGSYGWYDSDMNYGFYGAYEDGNNISSDDVLIRTVRASKSNYTGPQNGYDDAMVMVAGGVGARFWFEKIKVTQDEVTYRIKLQMYDDFDFNAGGYKGEDASISNFLKYTGMMLSLGLLHTFKWIVNTELEITLPNKCDHETSVYRWEFNGKQDMVSVSGDGIKNNTLIRKDTEGTCEDGVFSKTYYLTDRTIHLWHDKPWVLEFRSIGTGTFAFGETSSAGTGRFIRKTSTTLYLGDPESYKEDGKTKYIYHFYGLNTGKGPNKVSSKDVHTYRLENRIADDGSNMVYLYIDDVEIGPMNNYYISSKDQEMTVDWVNGQDIMLNYIGNASYKLNKIALEYVQVWENGVEGENFAYYSTKTVAPTCTEQGYVVYTCSQCDGVWHGDHTAAKGHSFTESMTEPDCENPGYHVYTCSVCGHVEKKAYMPALGHKPVADAGYQPDCVNTGLTDGSHCEVCDKVLVAQETVSALGHAEVTDAGSLPDCLNSGLTEGKHCDVCKEVLVPQTVIPALGHDTVVDEAVAPSCTETGLTEGSHCGRCAEVFVAQLIVEALGHSEVTDEYLAPTCVETGLTEGSHCGTCGEVFVAQNEIPALGHTEVVDELVNSTCNQTGLTKGSHCGVCNEILIPQYDIPVLGHVEVVDQAVEATCTKNGRTEGSHCAICREVIVASEQIPALGHEELVTPGKTATCTEAGLTEGVDCLRCGETVALQEEIPALGHEEVVQEGVEANCVEDGLTEGSYCGRCDAILVQQEVIPAFGHSVIHRDALAPDCTNSGWEEASYCETCGEVFLAGNELAPLGHEVVIDEAVISTCTQTGLTEGSHCGVCNVILVERKEIPRSGHTVVTDEPVEPTCSQTGLTEGSYCGVCGEILARQEIVPALGHAWKEEVLIPGGGPDGEDEIRLYCECGDYISELVEKPVNPFKDVKEADFYYDSVQWAVSQEITKGMSENAFAPEVTCTRGQVVTFLWRAFGEPEPESEENPFTDVKESAYYYKAVLWAVEQGITKGVSATAFDPEAPCTRGHVVTFLHRAMENPETEAENPFMDVSTNAYYYNAVLWAVEEEVTKGTSENTFSPDAPCTRGQIVTFLYRALA